MNRQVSKLQLSTLLRPTLALGLVGAIALIGCGKNADDATFGGTEANESAQQVGDVMASLDESGGSSSGSMAEHVAAKKMFARVLPGIKMTPSLLGNSIIPSALAAACKDTTFSACTDGEKARTFDACTLGTATMSGSVTLTFSGADCLMNDTNDTATRVPSFTITGPRGGSYSVSKTGTNGQRLTRGSGTTFTFSNDGIRRVASFNGTTIFDFTTTTTSDLTFTGTSRASRTLTTGSLRVTNNSTSEVCDYTPTNLVWVAGCNCPTSGSWAKACSPDATKNATLTMTSTCGTATLTSGGVDTTVSLDRCI